MTKRELWLKLFQENDTALACAIHLCERFLDDNQLYNGREFIQQKRSELEEKVSREQMIKVFGVINNAQRRK